jgi:uncharacterized membrane protein YedE/YeeE
MQIAASHIVVAGLLGGAAAGAVMHRADFCIAGAFRDLFLFKRFFMMRILLLLVASSAVAFDLARRLGLLPFYPFPLLGDPSLSNIAGGLLFGVGMVAAGGCVVGTLYRSGTGNLPAMAAVAGLVLGSAIYAEIHPAWAAFARSTAFLRGRATIPGLLGVDPTWLVVPLAAASAVAIVRWRSRGLLVLRTPVEGFVQPWAAAVALSLLGLFSWIVAGMPFGITTSYAKAAAWIESAVIPGHFASVAFFKAVPLDVTYPSGMKLQGGPGPGFDGISLVQFPLIAGIVAGSFLSAVSLGEFRIGRGVPARQIAFGLAGGVMMGLASRMAPGCNVWHVMGGLPILAIPSILFTLALLPGAWIGGRILGRVV